MNAPEPDSTLPQTRPALPRWRAFLRFSLRTLLLGVLLCGCGMGLYWRWEPWVLERTFTHPNYRTGWARFSADGTRVITTVHDGNECEIWFWDVESGKKIAGSKVNIGFGGAKQTSPDGRLIASSGKDAMVRLWEASSGREIARFERSHPVSSWVFSPDWTRIIVADDEGTASVYDAGSGQEIGKINERSREPIHFANFSPDGSRILTRYGKSVRLWDALSFQQILELDNRNFDTIRTAAFSPNGQRIVTTSKDTARVWNTVNGQEIANLNYSHMHPSIQFSPDGRRLLTAGLFTFTRMWDADRGVEIATQFPMDTSHKAAAFSPDGERIFTINYSGWLHLWDAQGNPLGRLDGNEYVNSAAFSPDGTRLLMVLGDRTCVWLRRRPEHAWGIFVLPELWLGIFLLGGFVFSLRRDWRSLQFSRVAATHE